MKKYLLLIGILASTAYAPHAFASIVYENSTGTHDSSTNIEGYSTKQYLDQGYSGTGNFGIVKFYATWVGTQTITVDIEKHTGLNGGGSSTILGSASTTVSGSGSGYIEVDFTGLAIPIPLTATGYPAISIAPSGGSSFILRGSTSDVVVGACANNCGGNVDLLYLVTDQAGIDNSTRIISFDPDGYTINPTFSQTATHANATTTVATWFNDVTDTGVYDQVCIELSNIENQTELVPRCHDIIASGGSSYTDVYTNLPQGQYFVIAYFYSTGREVKEKNRSFEFTNMYTNVPVSMNGLFGQTYGTTTSGLTVNGALLEDCSALDGVFARVGCSIVNSVKTLFNKFFVPDMYKISATYDVLKNQVLNKAPIGYVTRMISIVSGSATSSMPIIGLHFMSDSPVGSTTLAFNPNTILASASTITNSIQSKADSPKTIWEIIMPTINTVAYSILIVGIIMDLLGMSIKPKHKAITNPKMS